MADQLLGNTLSTSDIELIQRIAAGDSLAGNSLLPDSVIPLSHFQLNTTRKNIIQAINELVTKVNAAQLTVSNFNDRFNFVVGNEEDEESLDFSVLQDLDVNLIKILIKLKSKVDALESSPAVGGGAGDQLLATEDTLKGFSGLTINEYADLAPGAWVGTFLEFQSVGSVVKNNGTYFVYED